MGYFSANDPAILYMPQFHFYCFVKVVTMLLFCYKLLLCYVTFVTLLLVCYSCNSDAIILLQCNYTIVSVTVVTMLCFAVKT